MISSSYRPHNPGHDYYEAGAYLITLVVAGRERRLSSLGDSSDHPQVLPTDTGRIVEEEWARTAVLQRAKGRDIDIRCQVCMPDHWHGVIVVNRRMDISVGTIINAFKSVCTSRWRREVTGYVQPPCTATMIRHMSKERRHAYYSTRPLVERPLFDDDYDDTICLDAEHLRRMEAYVADNPRRAIVRRLHPQFMQRSLNVVINGRSYAAFGNLFLLGWARKQQVFCHRKARLSGLTAEERQQYGYVHLSLSAEQEEAFVTRVPYHTTTAFRNQGNGHYLAAMAGATVLVTPGISEGEKRVKNMALERGLPLIHLQKEPIGPYWKPEQQRFDACIQGRLLIIAPWDAASLGDVNGIPSASDYSQFHNLNTLAEVICGM
ncbi:MAG: transposase [Bacteroidaceae bacterium]|nr:transposase [Bacteroidaceae bacterium]